MSLNEYKNAMNLESDMDDDSLIHDDIITSFQFSTTEKKVFEGLLKYPE